MTTNSCIGDGAPHETPKGSEKAACWADAKTGRTKNIYDVGITSVGFKIRRRAYPEWTDAKGLPLVDDSVLGKELTESQFKRSVQPIFRWSVDQECRFHVRLFDLTQVNDLKIYKRRRLILEDYFFKFERHNETW